MFHLINGKMLVYNNYRDIKQSSVAKDTYPKHSTTYGLYDLDLLSDVILL